jgi:hypothetical protein
MASPPRPRELFLDHSRVMIGCPRLMTDSELADVLAAFVETVRARPSTRTAIAATSVSRPQAALIRVRLSQDV